MMRQHDDGRSLTATEAQRLRRKHREHRFEDDSTRRREAATADWEKAREPRGNWAMLTCASSVPAHPARSAGPPASNPLCLCGSVVTALIASQRLRPSSGPQRSAVSDSVGSDRRCVSHLDLADSMRPTMVGGGAVLVMLQSARPDVLTIPAGTRVEVAISPPIGPAPLSWAAPRLSTPILRGNLSRFMDHEELFGVRDRRRSARAADAGVHRRHHDLRPRPILLILVAAVRARRLRRGKLLIRRRMQRPGGR